MIRKTTALIAGLGAALGAGVMYLLDPKQGRRRRSLVGDKLTKARHKTQDAVTRTARDAKNRASGLAHEAKLRVGGQEGDVPDDVLVNRVRAEMGHVIEKPQEVTVTSLGGRVTLSGKVKPEEVERLTSTVSHVAGVVGVENRLDTSPKAGQAGVN